MRIGPFPILNLSTLSESDNEWDRLIVEEIALIKNENLASRS